ncbi:MAG: lipopolysaccharide biosynthesis protein [Terriglobia bacterium]|nr:lipopolysaccharide biosynthesis protein [Terriglobia bacterium]
MFDRQHLHVIISTISGGAGNLLATVGPLLTTPIILPYIGDFRYGVWMMLLSINALLGLSDFGVANGVITPLSQLRNDVIQRRKLISNVYAVLWLLFVGLLIVVAVVVLLLSQGSRWSSEGVKFSFVMSIFLPTLITVPLAFINRLLYIDMRGSIAGLSPGFSSLFSVVIAFAGTWARLPPDVLLLLFLSSSPITYFCMSVYYFGQQPELRPRPKDFELQQAKLILRSGLRFLPLSLLVILCNRIDYVIVGKVNGVGAVVPYAIADRLVGIVTYVATILSAALWPVFASEIKKANFAWVRSTLIKTNVVTVFCYLIFMLLMVWKYDAFVGLWLHRRIETPAALLIFLCLSSLALTLSAPYFALANSLGAVRQQMIAYLLLLSIGLPGKFLLGSKYGATGVAMGAFISWALIMWPAIMFLSNAQLRKAENADIDRRKRRVPDTECGALSR